MYTRSPDYLYCRNGIYYFTRNVPSDLKSRFNKNRVVVSLHTRSISRAQKSATALSDRLDRYFESLRLERFHSQELGLSFSLLVTPAITQPDATISEALNIYIRLKGIGICAPVHDAILIEAPLNEIEDHVRLATSLMQRASGWVLGRGRQCRVDAETVRWPDRYMDGRGANMWSFIQSHLGEEAA
jgi:hypothetical protein